MDALYELWKMLCVGWIVFLPVLFLWRMSSALAGINESLREIKKKFKLGECE